VRKALLLLMLYVSSLVSMDFVPTDEFNPDDYLNVPLDTEMPETQSFVDADDSSRDYFLNEPDYDASASETAFSEASDKSCIPSEENFSHSSVSRKEKIKLCFPNPHETLYQAQCITCKQIFHCRDKAILSVLNDHLRKKHGKKTTPKQRNAMIVAPVTKIFTIGTCGYCGYKTLIREYHNIHTAPAQSHHQHRRHPGGVRFTFLRINLRTFIKPTP
jgi:hypothetical protein